jgi:hypothetical protein
MSSVGHIVIHCDSWKEGVLATQMDVIMPRLLSYQYSSLQSLSIEFGQASSEDTLAALHRVHHHFAHLHNSNTSSTSSGRVPLRVLSIWCSNVAQMLTDNKSDVTTASASSSFSNNNPNISMVSLMGVIGVEKSIRPKYLGVGAEEILKSMEESASWCVLQLQTEPSLHASVSPLGTAPRCSSRFQQETLLMSVTYQYI